MVKSSVLRGRNTPNYFSTFDFSTRKMLIFRVINTNKMRVSPTYAINSDVHHNNNQCTERNNIEDRNLKRGDGNRKLCKHCKRLNAEGK